MKNHWTFNSAPRGGTLPRSWPFPLNAQHFGASKASTLGHEDSIWPRIWIWSMTWSHLNQEICFGIVPQNQSPIVNFSEKQIRAFVSAILYEGQRITLCVLSQHLGLSKKRRAPVAQAELTIWVPGAVSLSLCHVTLHSIHSSSTNILHLNKVQSYSLNHIQSLYNTTWDFLTHIWSSCMSHMSWSWNMLQRRLVHTRHQ